MKTCLSFNTHKQTVNLHTYYQPKANILLFLVINVTFWNMEYMFLLPILTLWSFIFSIFIFLDRFLPCLWTNQSWLLLGETVILQINFTFKIVWNVQKSDFHKKGSFYFFRLFDFWQGFNIFMDKSELTPSEWDCHSANKCHF